MTNTTAEQQDRLAELVVWYPEYHWFWEIVDLVDEFVGNAEWYKIQIDIEHESHESILIDILQQLEKLWWASFEETKEEWTTLLMCARENPEFIKRKSKVKPMRWIITWDIIKY